MSNLTLSDNTLLELEVDYWKNRLKGVEPLQLFTDYPRSDVQSNNKASVGFFIDEQLTAQLNQFSEQHKVTLLTTLLSAFKALLYRYSNQEDICVGNVVSATDNKEKHFLNVSALRTEINGNDRFVELLHRVNTTMTDAYQHQKVPFEKLADLLMSDPGMGMNPLYQVMFILQNGSAIAEITSYTSKSELAFILKEKSPCLHGMVEYNTDLYQEETIFRIIDHYKLLLSVIITHPKKSIGSFPILTQAEEYQLMQEFNKTAVAYSKDKTIVDLFEEQVKKTPGNKAVIFEHSELSYQELNVLANKFGDYLRNTYQIKPDDLVGIMLERNEWMIIAILGIMKAGGAYVPIAPDYPQERINYLVQDSGCKVLIDEQELEKFKSIQNTFSQENHPTGLQPHHLAYCIYTSGSTGNPKGCLLQHNGLVNRLEWMQKAYPLSANDVILQKTTFSFDVSVWELLWWAIQGASVCMLQPGGEKSPEIIVNAIEDNKVTVMHFVPSMLSVFLEYLKNDKTKLNKLTTLKQVFTSGEALKLNQAERFHQLFSNKSLMNLYGPTEASIDVTYFDCKKENLHRIVPIGKPIDNTQIYILDKFRNLLPAGAAGEICLGGVGLARGYLNRPELTAEKFIENPFIEGERIYRTGDQGRWMADGNIEYLGRIDDQVKIRGFRIELGEITSVLERHTKVEGAVVIAAAVNGHDKELIAYTTGQADALELREYLRKQLPAYMVPGYYVHLELLPLTSNGKVNKKALPLPEGTGIGEVTYIAPSTGTEKTLVRLWAEVLGIPEKTISVKGDFFDMGGHSIKAIRLLGLIHKELGVKLALKELFSDSTIERLAIVIADKELETYQSITVITEEPDYQLSSAQRRLWVLNQYEGVDGAYNISYVIQLEGQLDKTALKSAFEAMAFRHEALRTVFKEDKDGAPRQHIISTEQYRFQLKETDLRATADRQRLLNELIERDNIENFDFTEGPLWRCHLLHLETDQYILVMVHHHIISDGWSMDIFRKEWCAFYNAFTKGKELQLPSLRIQYKDYAAWHTHQLESVDVIPHKDYWIKQFEGEIPVLELPADKERPAVKTFNGASLTTTIDNEVVEKLNKTGKLLGGTLFMSLLTCVNALFYRYTNQEDIIIGSPTAGREHPDLEDQIGFYINTLALRTRFNGAGSYEDLFQQVKEVTLGAYEHQLYPYDELVDALKLPRNINRNPLFDVMVVLQNAMEQDAEFTLNGLQTNIYEGGEYKVAKFDISLIFSESKKGLVLFLDYNTDIYSTEQMKRMLRHFENIITSVIKDPKQNLAAIDFLTNQEKHLLLKELNQTAAVYPKDKTIIDLFEEQVDRTPKNKAIIFEDSELSYQELNELSNQFGDYLRKTYNIKPDDLVGMMLARSEWMIIAIVGIMKSGGAYVPIDPEYPQERINYMVQDSGCKVLIDEKELEKFRKTQSIYKKENHAISLQPHHLIYCIYTSGSTGNPKGVLVEHKNVVNLIWSQKEVYNITEDEKVLQLTTITFDPSVEQTWIAFLTGAALVITSKTQLLDIKALEDYIIEKKVSHIQSVPAHIVELSINNINSIKRLSVGGESCPPLLAEKWKSNSMFINAYGPTETTVVSIQYKVEFSANYRNFVPIGKPIANTEIYILDAHQRLLPYGVLGEICIGGDGITRGYLNRPELTEEKFIKNPFINGKRIYRTGDLGRWMADGNIEYLGRIDDQVKIRGYRIELDEITSVLQKHGRVKDAVVIAAAIKGRDKELIAYTTGGVEAAELKKYLKEQLPAYMVPGYYVHLDNIPLTTNGKVNKKILPLPDGSGVDEVAYVAASTGPEKALVRIWAEVLGMPEKTISITGDFFDMGGHSIKAIRLLGLIHKELGVKLALKELFSDSTIERLAIVIANKELKKYEVVQVIQEEPDYRLSSAQQRLWIINHFEGADGAYNIPYVIQLEGQLDKTALKSAFEAMAFRHEALRTVFKEDKDGAPRQHIISTEQYRFQLKETDLRATADRQRLLNQLIERDNIENFDFTEGPLWRCHLLHLETDQYILVMVHHHIISDGWSMDIFRKEWCAFYNAFTKGKELQLPSLRIQYKDYAAWHTHQLESVDVIPHKDYWVKQFEGEIPVLELPADKERPAVKTFNGASLTTTIDNEVVEKLNKTGKLLGGTLFMSLLTCVNALFYRYTNQEDIIIGSPTAGREHPDLEDQIGFYINTLALRTRFNGAGSYEDLFQQVKEVTLGAYEHQLYPYDELVDALKLPRNINRNPLFDVMVVLQDSIKQFDFKLNGLQTSIYEGGEYKIAKFDISFMFSESENGLELFLDYNTDIYSTEQMKRMLRHFENIVASIAEDPKQSLGAIDFLTNEEKQKLLYEFNNTLIDYPREKTLAGIFEEQVLKAPDAIALRQHDQEMSYRELNSQANQLARYLVDQGVNKGDNIGLLVTRGFNMIIGMFGILKAGGAYVPIDPGYPIDRQEYILQNSAVTKVIADGDYPLEKLTSPDLFVKLKTLDLTVYANNNLGLEIDSTQLAYTIYTSGSTGRPKGVMIEHHSAVNLVLWVNTEFNIGTDDRLLFITSMCFDLSVYDIFGMLSAGGSLVIVEQQELMDVPVLKDMMIKYKITFWDSVPTTMDYLVRELEAHNTDYLQETLKVVFMSGDWIPVNLPERIKKYFPNTKVISLGGATEGTVWSNFYPVEKVDSKWGSIPYGRPMNNNFFYILNEQLQPAPIGVVGELYIGGVGVARGYANDKEKTDYAFVKDPFNDRAGGRMYRTGDLGRMLPDLNMEFIGRKDDQVKIRGYRIELGEIESVLRQCELVSQAVVLAKADKERKKRLVGYIVGKENYDRLTVISFLKSKLPDYMVPTLWVELENIPLTSNGKIDKKALPEFDAEEQIKDQYVAPRTESEKVLVEIWEDVLKINNVGVTHDFFDLGGHSLLAVQIVNQIKKRTGRILPISILFKYGNIESLNAFLIENDTEKEIKSLVPIKPSGNKMPVYFVHGVGLNVMNFADLAMYLDKDQPVFGLQALGLGGKFPPVSSMSDIAKIYVAEIMEHNPAGPYAIAGYSLGGFIAMEMRRQFELIGKEVKVLAIIDTFADHTDDFITLFPKKLKRHLKKWINLSISFIRKPGETIQNQKNIRLEDEQYRYDAIKLAKESGDMEYYKLLKLIKEAYLSALRTSPRIPFNELVYLFRASTSLHYTNDKQYLGWRKYALKGVKEYEISGDHRTMLLKPNVEKFSRILQEILDDANN